MDESIKDSDPRAAPSRSDLVGRTIGSYRITRKLGEGGFGAVYLGRHPEIESRVAIKVLRPEFVKDTEMVERFLDEARAVNRIGHRGVVQIHDTGRLPDVGAYLVMEYLEGESLQARSKRLGPLPTADAVRFAMQACTALGACHRADIIHRDLKPANMHIVADEDLPGGERVIILDFGIAKLAQQRDIGSNTATGALLGTPLYMSPEQCLDTKHVDHRSDIFSLGVVLYELLGGRCPYEAKTLGQLVLKHRDEVPPSLSGLRSGIPPALDQAVRRALERLPQDRFQSMDELRRALKRAVDRAASLEVTAPREPVDPAAIGEAETFAPVSESIPPAAEAPADHPRSRGPWLIITALLLGGVGLFVAMGDRHAPGPAQPRPPAPREAGGKVPAPEASATSADAADLSRAVDAAPTTEADQRPAPDGGHPPTRRAKPKTRRRRRGDERRRPKPPDASRKAGPEKKLYFKKL